MAFDGKTVLRNASFENLKLFISSLKGQDNIWIEKRIKHLNAEIERLYNQKNGLLKKFREISTYALKITKTIGTKNLVSGEKFDKSKTIKFNEPIGKTKISFEGDDFWIYRETPYPLPPKKDDFLIPDGHAISDLVDAYKNPYLKSIYKYFEKIEYKIKKVLDLIEILKMEKLLLEYKISKPTGNTNQKTNDDVLLEQLEQEAIITKHITNGSIPDSQFYRLLPRPASEEGT